jgi:hypothetical protein
MALTLGYRQAIKVRPQTALKNRAAVDDEMMRRDRSGNARRVRADKIGSLCCRDVFDDDFQAGVALEQRQQALLHEHRFAIENIYGRIGCLAMNEHRHADLFHALKYRSERRDIGDPVMRVGRCTGRIEFGRNPNAFGMAFFDFIR